MSEMKGAPAPDYTHLPEMQHSRSVPQAGPKIPCDSCELPEEKKILFGWVKWPVFTRGIISTGHSTLFLFEMK